MNINHPLQSIFRLFLLTTIVNSFSVNIVAAEVQIFGRNGTNGVNGRSGRSGISASSQVIKASQQLQTINLFGTDGENGESATSGSSASICQQPKNARNNVCGANGGNGGNGGWGGNGGNGGNATIYFETISQLRNVLLRNGGGKAGIGGNGGEVGNACNCTQSRWNINYCTWALMSKQRYITDAKWREIVRKVFRCTGDAFYDEQQSRPKPVDSNSNYTYGWKYIGLYNRETFRCDNGQSGNRGNKGQDGQSGNYGQVWLVQGKEIPRERVGFSDRISQITDKNIPLLKNNWLQKTGLRSLLGNGSDVRDDYRLLQTVQGAFIVTWKTKIRPQDLGEPEITGKITESGQLLLNIPGTLEYKITDQKKQSVVTITGGINPNRLGKYKFKGFDLFRDARNFTLTDDSTLLPELKAVNIKIMLYQNDSKVSEFTYPVALKPPFANGLTVWNNNLYKINLGDRFDSFLQAGQPVKYDIRIDQITRSGSTYTSGMKIDFIVDKATSSPKVEYY
jgi:hypothetical protein